MLRIYMALRGNGGQLLWLRDLIDVKEPSASELSASQYRNETRRRGCASSALSHVQGPVRSAQGYGLDSS